jgi:membrane protease YdiL (CAAX protease family)
MAGILLIIVPFWKPLPPLVKRAIQSMTVAFSVYIVRRFLDKRSFQSLGLKLDAQTLVDISAGLIITFVLMGLIYLAEVMLGWSTLESFAWNIKPASAVITGTLMYLAFFILVSMDEELLFRGYHLQTLISGLNLFWALLISSAVFGILHLSDPNATWAAAIGVLFAGLFLSYAYIRTEQLWLSIGLHIGWNFFQGVVFGFSVSGVNGFRLIHHQVTGPELWTGGAFGPEAGLIILPAISIGIALIYVYTRYIRKSDLPAGVRGF